MLQLVVYHLPLNHMTITSAKNEQIQIKWQFHLPQWLITSATYESSGQNLPLIKMAITSAR